MEHTNLFLFENQSAFEAEYPNDRVDSPIPGVAYVRAFGSDEAATYYNRMVTAYTITIHSVNKSGVTVAEDHTVQSPKVLDGNTVKMNIVGEEIEGYKPRYASEKIEIDGDDYEHTITYLAATSYTITVHHMCDEEEIAEDTEIILDGVFEEDVVKVKIEPVNVIGYQAETAYIFVSGDTEYTLEYEKTACYVDLGLPSGTLWACTNVGAEAPLELGTPFAWGEVETKEFFSMDNYKFYDTSSDDFTKYNDSDNKVYLELEDDAAHANMGGEWHMPTIEQIYELLDNTTTETIEGGVVFISNINGNSITIPYNENEECYVFWSNTLGMSLIEKAGVFAQGCENQFGPAETDRYKAYYVRGVIGDGPQDNLGPVSPASEQNL